MESHKLVVKLFADGAAGLPPDAAIPVFHRWIQDQAPARPPADRRGRLRPRAQRPGHGARHPRGQHPPRPRGRQSACSTSASSPSPARRRSASASPTCSAPPCMRADKLDRRPGPRQHPLPHQRDRLPHQRPPARPEHRGDVRRGEPRPPGVPRRAVPGATSRSSTSTTTPAGCSRCGSSPPPAVRHATFWPAWSLRRRQRPLDEPAGVGGQLERQRRLLTARATSSARCAGRSRSPSPRRAARRTPRSPAPGTPGKSSPPAPASPRPSSTPPCAPATARARRSPSS